VTSFDAYGNLLPVSVHRLLNRRNAGGRFNGRAENDIAAVADSAQNPPRMVGLFAAFTKTIIVFRSSGSRRRKSVPHLKAFHSSDGKHGGRQLCVQLIKYRISQPCRYMPDHTLDNASCGILLSDALFQQFCRSRRGIHIRHIYGILQNRFSGEFSGVGPDSSDLLRISKQINPHSL